MNQFEEKNKLTWLYQSILYTTSIILKSISDNSYFLNFRIEINVDKGPSCKELRSRDFPGGPVVGNPPSPARDMGLIPGRETNFPCATGQLKPGTATRDSRALHPLSPHALERGSWRQPRHRNEDPVQTDGNRKPKLRTRKNLLWCFILKWENAGPERLSDFPRMTPWVSGHTGLEWRLPHAGQPPLHCTSLLSVTASFPSGTFLHLKSVPCRCPASFSNYIKLTRPTNGIKTGQKSKMGFKACCLKPGWC